MIDTAKRKFFNDLVLAAFVVIVASLLIYHFSVGSSSPNVILGTWTGN